MVLKRRADSDNAPGVGLVRNAVQSRTSQGRALRVLIASHSHPSITRGGAEVAAFRLFEKLCELPDYEAWFLGCQTGTSGGRLGVAISQPFSAREFIYNIGEFDSFKFANRDTNFPEDFCGLLRELQPDVIHFHHFTHFGVEAFFHARTTLPDAKIVLTFHEFLAVCHRYGQMVTHPDDHLCYEATPQHCNRCFPEISQADFFLRKLYIQSFFKYVDNFITPSYFLAQRLRDWGIPSERLTVIENLTPTPEQGSVRRVRQKHDPLRVGFFGQLSRLKGINVLLDAAKMLEDDGVNDITFEIHGHYRGQPLEFQVEMQERIKDLGRNVRCHGAYDPARTDRLMRGVGVTIVPSIWWENSPVVIQEAFRNRRPVICSDIGGMSEKVRDGMDGWHFPVGNAAALAALLKRLADEPGAVQAISESMQFPGSFQEVLDAHIEIYSKKAGTLLTDVEVRSKAGF
ncbi:MAG: glycosyltransferase [Alloacidobacterium sp.]